MTVQLLRTGVRFLLLLGMSFLLSCHRETAEIADAVGHHHMQVGKVQKTKNPQVALYTIAPEQPAFVTIFFGQDGQYRQKTWTRRAQGHGIPLQIYVAGMYADCAYHMRAQVRFDDGSTITDRDHLFHTGQLPKRIRRLPISAEMTAEGHIQPGVELLNSTTGITAQGLLTDLSGRILWSYEMPDWPSRHHMRFLRWKQRMLEQISSWLQKDQSQEDTLTLAARAEAAAPQLLADAKRSDVGIVNPIEPLRNGNFLLVIGLPSQVLLLGPPPDGAVSSLREINFAGETVRELTIEQLNRKLHSSGHPELQLQLFHHDAEILPNGHWLAIANAYRPGKHPRQGETDIFGDVIVDLDQNLNPVWTWSSFDHLDIARRPMWSPDWTHANAVVYCPEDGNLLFSLRHQSWVLKIDYRNGKGTGKILWRLGHDGDLKMISGRDPQDMPHGQHLPAILGAHSAGVFRLTLMDNGNSRPGDNGVPCREPGMPGKGEPCYTAVPVYEIDEAAKTVKLIERKTLPAQQFSTWGGNTVALANGDIETTLSSQGDEGQGGKGSTVLELAATPELKTLWQLHIATTLLYRAQRLPSPYPGVQW